MKLPKKLSFLKSSRFWAMVLGAVMLYLQQEGIVDQNLANLIATITGGFVGVKTVDKFHQK